MPVVTSTDAIRSLTDWWEEMGVDVDESQVSAFLKAAEQAEAPPPQQAQPSTPSRRKPKNWVEEARSLAAGCETLEQLKAAIESFDGSPLKAAAQARRFGSSQIVGLR